MRLSSLFLITALLLILLAGCGPHVDQLVLLQDAQGNYLLMAQDIGTLPLGSWSKAAPDAGIRVFNARTLQDTSPRMHAALRTGASEQYIGVFQEHLGIPGLQSLFVQIEDERFLLFYTSLATPKMLYIERQATPDEASSTTKASTMEYGFAIVPILQATDTWDRIAFIGIEQMGTPPPDSKYALEQRYEPALDISSFIHTLQPLQVDGEPSP